MNCPRCQQPAYQPTEACSTCHFQGDPALIEELDRVRWLLAELALWPALDLTPTSLAKLQAHYQTRRDELEIALGVPPFTAAEAVDAWLELIREEVLLDRLAGWIQSNLVEPVAVRQRIGQAHTRIAALRARLTNHVRPVYPQTPADHLAVVEFLLEIVPSLAREQAFTTSAAEQTVKAELLAEQEKLETLLGLRPEPVLEATAEAVPVEVIEADVTEAEPVSMPVETPRVEPAPPPPPVPTTPWRERFWRSLLSERTLQAILTLGIFLLFSAAISFVVWGWRDFSAPVRVAIPAGFTLLFFGLGRFVRRRTNLYRSGLALSAIAALLVPIDFYTIYVNFNVPENYAALFWFLTSLVCLGAYTVSTILIQSRFFGYLVVTAAGSVVLSAVQIVYEAGLLDLDWRWAGLALLATILLIIATYLDRRKTETTVDWHNAFAEPFRYLSLLTFGVLLPLLFVWRYLDRSTYDALHGSLTVAWWLGGFAFGWGALHYRSRSLGFVSAFSLPFAVYLTQAAIFDYSGANPAWHAFGLAGLVPLYLVVGQRLLRHRDDALYQTHGRTALITAQVLALVAALWSLTDLASGAAAAGSHAILAASALLAVRLWRDPRPLYAASFFALTALTFTLTELGLTLGQLTPGWITLSLGHVLIALQLGRRRSPIDDRFITPLVRAGYAIAALALLPSLIPYNQPTLTYAVGNWIGLAGWGAWLAYNDRPGFVSAINAWRVLYHWAAALPLPFWLWLLFDNAQSPDWTFPAALVTLAWGMVALSHRLKRIEDAQGEDMPWYIIGMFVSMAGAVTAFAVSFNGTLPGVILIAVGLLYLVDAFASRYSWLLPIGSPVIWIGLALWLDRSNLPLEIESFSLALLVSSYYGLGLWLERRRSQVYDADFLKPLYYMAHFLVLIVLGQVYFNLPWTDSTEAWGAATQILLAGIYGLYAWARYEERWAHLTTWLLAAGGGMAVLAVSSGHGLSTVGAAVLAAVYVLTERGLGWWWRRPGNQTRRWRGLVRLIWRLFRRPLLVTGWLASAGTIMLALGRNLVLLGGFYPRLWAWVSLLIVTGLYTASARLFRQQRFAWLASILIFAPWTILTHEGWYTAFRPTTPGYAVCWVILVWLLYLLALGLRRLGQTKPDYAQPPGVMAQAWLVFALAWGIADVATSRFTFGLAIGLYIIAAILDQKRYYASPEPVALWRRTKFLYPAVMLVPVWATYLLTWLLPAARHEHFGLLLLAFGPLGFLAGEWLRRLAPEPKEAVAYALPGYLTAYLSLIVGTMLVVHLPALLALVLLFDSLLLIGSAYRFRNPLWIYPAGLLAPLALLIALSERDIASNRHGWGLISLAAIYLAIAWALRRLRLPTYGNPVLAIGFALIALGLPPSSEDQIGALVGYGSAALLYGLMALWLRQPLLLVSACALFVVPYAVFIQRSGLTPEYYGLALYPGGLVALTLGWLLDQRLGAWRDFPWLQPFQWFSALAERVSNWWGFSPYLLGFGLTAAAPFFTAGNGRLTALNFALLMPVFGWAIYCFRLRGWLLATALAGHLAVFTWLTAEHWWSYPAELWLRFTPVTVITLLSAIIIERRRYERSPFSPGAFWPGWSRPLYALAALDMLVIQLLSLSNTGAGAVITLTHAVLIGGLASLWLVAQLPYVSTFLGFVAFMQWLTGMEGSGKGLPVALALLALVYGLGGYGLAFIRSRLPSNREMRPELAIWPTPLQWSGLVVSGVVLILTAVLGVNIIGWTVRALLGLPFREIVERETVLMVVRVFSLLGLLYLGAAYHYRLLRVAYGAVGLLLAAWLVYIFFVQQWAGLRSVQWYALPAGLYLLTIAYLEWQRGHRSLARSIDYAATFLMLGSLFWQTWVFGWSFFLLLIAEGLLAMWWGSARRLRRFLYTGMVGVVLATLGQLLNALRSVNQWLVFGLIGLLLVVAAVAVERKLEDLKAWQDSLETWE